MAAAAKVTKTVTMEVTVELKIGDPDVIERVTGPKGDEWRAHLYNIHTEEEVLQHLAYNCVANGEEDAHRLDGWADLPPEAVSMKIKEVAPA